MFFISFILGLLVVYNNFQMSVNLPLRHLHEHSFKPFVKFLFASGRSTTVTNSTLTLIKFGSEKPKDIVVNGQWILYSQPNYNWDVDNEIPIPGSSVLWVFGNGASKTPLKMNVQSFRIVGNEHDYRISGLALYIGNYYSGPVHWITGTEYVNLPFTRPGSLVLMGSLPWTLFTSVTFAQKSLCIERSKDNPFRPTAIPFFHVHHLTRPMRHLNSVHRNICIETSPRYPENEWEPMEGIKTL